METRSLSGIVILFVLVLVAAVVAGPAAAAIGPHGTTSLQDLINAKDVDEGSENDTVPQAQGEMNVIWTNTAGGDTTQADSAGQLITETDTGFDFIFSSITDAHNGQSVTNDGQQTVSAGDTAVYSAAVTNKGNNAKPVPFNFKHVFHSGSDTLGTPQLSNDTFVLELFYTNGDSDAVNFDTDLVGTSIYRADAGDSVRLVSEADTFTLFAHITVKGNATKGDALDHDLWVTDNAPIGNGADGTSGDQWRYDEGPTASGQDGRDTQARLLTTSIAGPEVSITKSLDLVNDHARPGDTVEYTLTVSNKNGSDTASNLAVYDAIPDSTTLVDTDSSGDVSAGSDSDVVMVAPDDTGVASGDFTAAGDDTLDGPFSDANPSPENVDRLRVQLPDLGPGSGTEANQNYKRVIRFWVTID